MTLEINLEKRACALLKAHYADPIKYGQEGLPDRMVLWGHGRHFWIEFKKAETGKLRPAQKVWRKYLESIGDCVYIVDTYEQMEHIIENWRARYGTATAKRPA